MSSIKSDPRPLPLPVSRAALFAGVLGMLVLSACSENAPAPQQAPPPQAVSVVTLKSQPITLTRELPGRTSAFLVAEVRPQVSGIVKERLFTEGALVKAGQPLYQLEDATYRADQASAAAVVARAQATLNSARLSARRSAELVKIDAISKQESESSAAALSQAEAELAAAQAALMRSNVVLGHSRINSPISGRIGKSSVTAGALVTANQTAALATVQQLDSVYVDLAQSSGELLRLRKEFADAGLGRSGNFPVKILLEDGSRHRHDGKLAFSDVTVDPGTGSYALRVVVPNPEGVLLPGMYVRALIGNGVRANGVLVPQQGITRDPKGNANAMVVGKDDKVEMRTVQTSRTVGDQWLVDGGLVAGDRVIVEGLQKIRPGAPVQATEFVPAVPATPAGSASPDKATAATAAAASGK